MSKWIWARTLGVPALVLAATCPAAFGQDAAPAPIDPTSPDFYGAVLGDTFSGPIEGEERVVYAVGGVGQPVWIRQPGFEIRCQNVVIWGHKDRLLDGLQRRSEFEATGAEGVLGPVIHTIYAEGDVYLKRDRQTVRADSVLVDFAQNRAYMVNAEVSGMLGSQAGKRIPLRVRAAIVRGTARDHIEAEDASFTTCSYEHPHYRFTTDRIEVDFDEEGAAFETGWWPKVQADTVFGDHTTLFVLPKLGGKKFQTKPLQDLSLGASGRFGSTLGVVFGGDLVDEETNHKWGTWSTRADYRSDRGPGAGLEFEYEGPSNGPGIPRDEGELEAYFQRDTKHTDEFSERGFDGTRHSNHTNDRGRVHAFYRRHGTGDGLLGAGSRLDAQVDYYSDRGFIPEYYDGLALTAAQQDTYLHLRRTWGNEGVSLLANYRLNDEAVALTRLPSDFRLTDYALQTQYLPSLTYHMINEPVFGEDSELPLNLSVQASAANVKRVYDERNADRLHRRFGWLADDILRADVETRVTAPFEAGPVHITPSIGGSLMAVDQSNGFGRTSTTTVGPYGGSTAGPDRGKEERASGFVGLRVGTEFHRFYDADSCFFLTDGLRHVVSIDAQWFQRYDVEDDRKPYTYQTNDLIDELGDQEIGSIRVRNRFQTKRDGEVIDWLDYEFRYLHFLEESRRRPQVLGLREDFAQPLQNLDFAGEDKYRFRNRHGSGFHQHRLRWQALPDVWVAGELDYDMEVRDTETSFVGVRWAATDRLSLYAGRRTILKDSRIWTLRGDYQFSEKWAISVEQREDARRNKSFDTQVTVFRRSHDYTIALEFESDNLLDENSFSLAIYPNHWLNDGKDPFSKRRSLDYEALRWYR